MSSSEATRPLKIAVVNHSFPPDVGGGETQTYLLAEGLRLRGHSVTVITGTQTARPLPGVRIIALPEFKLYEANGSCLRSFIPALKRALMSESFDAYHCVNFSSITAIAHFRDLLSGTLLFTFHSVPEPDRRKLVGYFDDWELELSSARQAIRAGRPDAVLATGSFMREWATQLTPPGTPIFEVQNCVRPADPHASTDSATRTTTRTRLGIRTDAFVYVSPIRMLRKKGILDLIEAIGYTDPRIVSVVATSRGNASVGTLEEANALIGRLGLAGRISLEFDSFDFVSLRQLFSACDAFVLPSHAEGQPVSILEAYASRLPVVATTTPGTLTIVRHQENGWLVPPRQPRALARMLSQVAELPGESRRAVAERAYDFVMARHSVESQVDRIESLLRQRHEDATH